MWQAIRENPRAVTYAVLMHVGLLLLLVISLDWTPKAIKPGTHKPIQAELVDSTKLQAVEEKKQAEQQRLAEEQRQREQEQQRKADQAAQQKAEAERKLKAEQAAKQKAEAEQVAKQKAEAERKRKAETEAKQKAAAEAKRKAEAEAKQKAAAEAKRKAEQAAKEKAAKEKAAKEKAAKEKAAAEAARQREAEQALQAQLAEEQAQARAESALSGYIPQIQQKIQRNWLRPGGSAGGLSCLIRVKLIPGGEVVDARVVRSSGDPLFDRSVETAVLKASPLPLPPDAAMFKYFREIDFNFNPDN
jgi:colicin import membrane protein